MSLSFGKIYIRSCSNPVFHIQNKALAVAAILDVFVGRVSGNCWTDAVFRHLWSGVSSREQAPGAFKFLRPHYHWLNCQIDILELCSTMPEICPQFL